MSLVLNGTPRSNLFAALRYQAQLTRGGRYTVKRGAVNWAAWDFARSPYGIAICHDQGFIFGSGGKAGGRRGTVTLEMATPMRGAADKQEDGIEDLVLDELLEDAARIIDAVAGMSDSWGNPLLLGFMRSSATFMEYHDAARLVQGIVAEFEVDY